ncbi:unnamed protein product [Blepharisma stoltei]|uniref:Uncharacterized protein n=1 Tax=Blepharisma stoltei TaxID=1481888 RepID=A0AAU9JFK2_9CILI|nr:unnamed protein product [Blepharisma stoltei]
MSSTSYRVNEFLERAKRLSQEPKASVFAQSLPKSEPSTIRKMPQQMPIVPQKSAEASHSFASTSWETPPLSQRSPTMSPSPFSPLKSPRFPRTLPPRLTQSPKPRELMNSSRASPKPKASTTRGISNTLESLITEILSTKKASKKHRENSKENESRALNLFKTAISKEKEKIVIDPQTKAIQELYEKKTQKFLNAIEEEVQQMSRRLKEAQEENKRLKQEAAEKDFSKEKPYFQDLNTSRNSNYDATASSKIMKEAKNEPLNRFEELSQDIADIKRSYGRNYAKDIENAVLKWYSNLDLENDGYQHLKTSLCKKINELDEERLSTEENANALLAGEEKKIADLELAIRVLEMRSHSQSTDKFMEVNAEMCDAVVGNKEVLIRKLANTVLQNVYNAAVETRFRLN